MWPTGYVPRWRAPGGPGTMPMGPALTTLKSMVARLASLVRCASIVYIVVQVIIWHSFYTAVPWRLAAPVIAVAWATVAMTYLRKRYPSSFLAVVDFVVGAGLALGAPGSVPPNVRDDVFSWLAISMSSQIMASVWFAPDALFVLIAVALPAAFAAGVMLQQVTDARTLAGAVILLVMVGLFHVYGRRELYGRAVAADVALARADQAASEQYVILRRATERREHERLVHDTVLNTLSALARGGEDALAVVVNRCRRDVALIEATLTDPGDLAGHVAHPSLGLVSQVQSIAADLRDRGLIVHVECADGEVPDVPASVALAISNAVREALSNVAAHAGTGEAWVRVRQAAPEAGSAAGARHFDVIVRDRGSGFDPARVDQTRLGLRRSIAERAADCGGHASIWSQPGQGTVVRLSWPASERPSVLDAGDSSLARESLLW
jgi:signal transduction histidine kinase